MDYIASSKPAWLQSEALSPKNETKRKLMEMMRQEIGRSPELCSPLGYLVKFPVSEGPIPNKQTKKEVA